MLSYFQRKGRALLALCERVGPANPDGVMWVSIRLSETQNIRVLGLLILEVLMLISS